MVCKTSCIQVHLVFKSGAAPGSSHLKLNVLDQQALLLQPHLKRYAAINAVVKALARNSSHLLQKSSTPQG